MNIPGPVYRVYRALPLEYTGALPLKYTGALPLEYTGALPLEYTGALPLEYAGALPLEYTGALPLDYTGALPLKYTGALPLHFTGALPLDYTGALPLKYTGASGFSPTLKTDLLSSSPTTPILRVGGGTGGEEGCLGERTGGWADSELFRFRPGVHSNVLGRKYL